MSVFKKNILILYYSRGVYPLRDTIHTHLYAWKNYSKHRIFYVNIAFGFPEKLLEKIKIDVIIFHTIFLSIRWAPEWFVERTAMCSYLKTLDCIKIAMPQDEFIHTELLNDFINDFGVTHILTCSYEKDWNTIYNKVDLNRVEIQTVLTGYLDKYTVTRIQTMGDFPRIIDIGYRAWKAEYWLGEHGLHKVRVAQVFEEAARNAGLSADISLEEKDVLNGDAWFAFLLRCRATIGVQGGASVLDRTGSIKAKVDAYLEKNPGASFEETRLACFFQEDNRLGLACISPRHLEACITRTCQILIEGEFNGILKPDVHYIPVKKDYSNVPEVLEKLKDMRFVEDMVERAYNDVVLSQKWTYESFVRRIEENIIEPGKELSASCPKALSEKILKAVTRLDRQNWNRIREEVQLKSLVISRVSRKTFEKIKFFNDRYLVPVGLDLRKVSRIFKRK